MNNEDGVIHVDRSLNNYFRTWHHTKNTFIKNIYHIYTSMHIHMLTLQNEFV